MDELTNIESVVDIDQLASEFLGDSYKIATKIVIKCERIHLPNKSRWVMQVIDLMIDGVTHHEKDAELKELLQALGADNFDIMSVYNVINRYKDGKGI